MPGTAWPRRTCALRIPAMGRQKEAYVQMCGCAVVLTQIRRAIGVKCHN